MFVLSIFSAVIFEPQPAKMISKSLNLFVKCIFFKILIDSIVLTAADSSCGPEFRGKCQCGVINYDYREQYVVNCTNNGFSNTSLLEHLPTEVEVIIFTGNVLSTLQWNIFGKMNDYPNLRIIDMSNNHIREIKGKTYHHVQLVERLILNHNNLSISPSEEDGNYLHPRIFSNFLNLQALHLTNAFTDFSSPALSEYLHSIFVNSNLTRLMKLHLEQNEITHFKDKNVFCDLPSLQDLHLGDNNLKEINFNVKCLHHLRFLDLERNKFEMIRTEDMKVLESVENEHGRSEALIVDFNLNPFICDCALLEFVDWMRNTNVTVRRKDKLTCNRGDNYPEGIIAANYYQRCTVKAQWHNINGGHEAFLVFFLVSIIFMLLGIVCALLWISRDRIRHFVSPVVSSRKVHYTTIRDAEVVQEVHV